MPRPAPVEATQVYKVNTVLLVKGGDIALNETPISKLRSVTCRMGSHSVTCNL